MLGNANILAGLMVLDNSREQTAHILAPLPQDFVEKEKAMLQYSRELFPSLPFRFIDILLVSCPGHNVIGADTSHCYETVSRVVAIERGAAV